MGDVAEVLKIFGEYGGIQGILLGAVLLHIFLSRYYEHQRQLKQDSRISAERADMCAALNKHTMAIERMTSALRSHKCMKCEYAKLSSQHLFDRKSTNE